MPGNKKRGRKGHRARVSPGLRGYPHAKGGPVMPGVAYRVGERGAETFIPNVAGNIIPNGGGGIHIHGPVYVTAPNPRVFLDELQRYAKGFGGQTRGRYGGTKLALG